MSDINSPYFFPFLTGGNINLIEPMLRSLPLYYNHVVDRIEYGKEGVSVHTNNGKDFKANAVLVTVPLGVLKKGVIQFEPQLPQRKLDSIARLGYGVLNKVC